MNTPEDWRRECEARYVLRLPFDQRRPYIELVGRRRGKEAQEALGLEVEKQRELIRAAA